MPRQSKVSAHTANTPCHFCEYSLLSNILGSGSFSQTLGIPSSSRKVDRPQRRNCGKEKVVTRARILLADDHKEIRNIVCLLYTSDAADERSSVDLGGRRI